MKRRYRKDDGGARHIVVLHPTTGCEGFIVRWTQHCTGCAEYGECEPAPAAGAGCHECGYTGKRRREEWVPFDADDHWQRFSAQEAEAVPA